MKTLNMLTIAMLIFTLAGVGCGDAGSGSSEGGEVYDLKSEGPDGQPCFREITIWFDFPTSGKVAHSQFLETNTVKIPPLNFPCEEFEEFCYDTREIVQQPQIRAVTIETRQNLDLVDHVEIGGDFLPQSYVPDPNRPYILANDRLNRINSKSFDITYVEKDDVENVNEHEMTTRVGAIATVGMWNKSCGDL